MPALQKLDGFLESPLVAINMAQVAVDLGIVGVQGDGLLVTPDGRFQILVCTKGIAEVVVVLGVLGVESDGFLEMPHGPIEFLLGQKSVAQAIVSGQEDVVGLGG